MRILLLFFFIRLNLFYYLSLYCRNVRNSLVVTVVRPRQRVSSRGSFYQANGTWLHLGLFRNNIQSTRTISLYIVFSFVTCFHLIKFIYRLEWYPGNRSWLRYPFGLALRHILPKIGAFILFLLNCLHSSVVRYSHFDNSKIFISFWWHMQILHNWSWTKPDFCPLFRISLWRLWSSAADSWPIGSVLDGASKPLKYTTIIKYYL